MTKRKRNRPIFYRAKFKTWLEKAETQGRLDVGQVGRPLTCPLATFILEEVCKDPRAYVAVAQDTTVFAKDGYARGEVYGTPSWARRFIRGVDNLNGRALGSFITPKQALDVFNDVS